jgi:DNA-binding transcriptional regulator YiaG
MTKQFASAEHQALLTELRDVRAAAIEHIRQATRLAQERRQLIDRILAEGFSQADLARELGVSRQAIQKMISVGR